MFNTWAQLMMLIYALVGLGLSYLEADQRKFWWAIGLKFYVLPTCIWAMIGAAEFSWVPPPSGCVTSKCLMEAGPARLMQTYIRMGGVLFAGLLYLAVVVFVRHYWNRMVAWDVNRLRNKVDLDKWYYDAASGEFYEITSQYDGAFSYQAVPWATRKMREHEAVKNRIGFAILSVICWAITLFLFVMPGPSDIFWQVLLWGMFGFSCLATIISFLTGITVRQSIKHTGPKPLRPRQDTTVEDQKVHDTGGFMGADELDEALSGKTNSKPIRTRPRNA